MKRIASSALSALLLVLVLSLSISTIKAQEAKEILVKTKIQPARYLTNNLKIENCIPLETTSESLLGRIWSIKFRNDTIFIFSKKQVFVFSPTGKYINTIGTLGRGPNEMILPSDFSVSTQNQDVAIWDNVKSTMFFYSLNGEIVKTFRPAIKRITNFERTDTGAFIYNSQFTPQFQGDYSIYLSDNSGKEISGHIPFEMATTGYGFLSFSYFPKYQNRQYAWIQYDPIIYRLTANNKLNPTYKIRFDSGNIGESELAKFKGNTHKLVDYQQRNEYNSLVSFNEFSNCYIISYVTGRKRNTNIIYKNNNKQVRIVIRDESFDPLGSVLPLFKNNECIVGVLQPYLLKSNMENLQPDVPEQLGSNYSALKKINAEIKVDDNPVLVVLRVKN